MNQNQAILDLTQQLVACDRKKPYVYISYSTRDGEVVYKTALELQKAGINLWIDTEVNFNTGEGYNSTIFHAIGDPFCYAVLLFISEHSFTSAQTAKEIAYVKSEAVQKSHKHELAIIGVELCEIEHHDLEIWVAGKIYQTYLDDMLSTAEVERIEKYRHKYNNKLERVHTKNQLAEAIMGYVLNYETERISFDEEAQIEKISQALKNV